MKHTTNYNLDLYEPNDLANLMDGHNDSMEKLDVAMKTVSDYVGTYGTGIEKNTKAISEETSRATSAENALSTSVANAVSAVNAETTRATAAEKVNADGVAANSTAIANEVKRAQTTENELATGVSNAVSAVNTERERATAAENSINSLLDGKFPVGTNNLADGSVTSTKLADSAIQAVLNNITIRRFDSTDSSADNTGMVVPSDFKLAGFFVENLNILVLNRIEKGSSYVWGSESSIVQLPSYVPATTGVVQISDAGLLEWDGSANYKTWTGLRLNGRSLYPNTGIQSGVSADAMGCLSLYLTPHVAGNSVTGYASYENANGVV